MTDPKTEAPYWPPGGSPDGNATVFTANGPGGTLMLVRAGPREGRVLPWRALGTGGPRELRAASGRFVMPEGGDALAAFVRTFPGWDKAGNAAIDAFAADVARWEADPSLPAAGRWAYFAGIAGKATLPVARAFGDAAFLRAFDGLDGMGRVDAAIARDPLLVDVLRSPGLAATSPERAAILFGDGARRARAEAILRQLCLPPARAPFLARLMALWEGRALPVPLDGLLRAAAHVPVDWVPADEAEARALDRIFAIASELARASRGALSVERLLAPVHGRWAEYLGTVLRLLPDPDASPETVCADVADGVAAFREDVVDPVRALAAWRLGRAPAGDPVATSWQALHGGRGLGAVLEGSRDWHARASVVSDAVAAGCGKRRMTWPRPFADHAAADGIAVTPLLDAASVALEGALMRNCIGSYGARLAEGQCALARIGRPGDDPRGRSVASLRMSGGKVEVSEHRGFQNEAPPEGHAEALAGAVAAIEAAGGLVLPAAGRKARRRLFSPADPQWVQALSYDPRPPESVGLAVAAWSRHLRQDLRDPLAVLALGDPRAAVDLRAAQDAPPPREGPTGLAALAAWPRRVWGEVSTRGSMSLLLLLGLEIVAFGAFVLVVLGAATERWLFGKLVFMPIWEAIHPGLFPDHVTYDLAFFAIALGTTFLGIVFTVRAQNRRQEGDLRDAVRRRRLARAEVGPVGADADGDELDGLDPDAAIEAVNARLDDITARIEAVLPAAGTAGPRPVPFEGGASNVLAIPYDGTRSGKGLTGVVAVAPQA